MTSYDILKIKEVIKNNRLIADRENKLKEMGYTIETRAMGTGGVGQVEKLKSESRMQIGYGSGRYNYAKVVIMS